MSGPNIVINDGGDELPGPPDFLRASALGSCMAAQVRRRLGFKEAQPPPEFLGEEGYFERGNRHEEAVLNHLMSEGWSISGQQDEVSMTFPMGRVVGHIDAVGVAPDSDVTFLLEAKTYPAHKRFIEQLGRFGRHLYKWTDPLAIRYAWQISFYQHALGRPLALLVSLDDDGKFHSFALMGDPLVPLEEISQRVETIEALVASTTIPACDRNDYPCPFYPFHEKKEDSPIEVPDATGEVQAALTQVVRAQAERKEWEQIEKDAREALRSLLDARHFPVGGKLHLQDGTVELYEVRGRETLDQQAMVEDGIDLAPYWKRGETRVQMKVTPRERDLSE